MVHTGGPWGVHIRGAMGREGGGGYILGGAMEVHTVGFMEIRGPCILLVNCTFNVQLEAAAYNQDYKHEFLPQKAYHRCDGIP